MEEERMAGQRMRLRGRMRLVAQPHGGGPALRRSASNIVLRGGAELVARRFAGADAAAIDRIGVGFGQTAADVGATALTPPADAAITPDALLSPVAPGDFQIATDRPDVVQVTLASVFHPTVELPDVSEAGLFADDRLYNQVVPSSGRSTSPSAIRGLRGDPPCSDET
jgi:hypothetical protein